MADSEAGGGSPGVRGRLGSIRVRTTVAAVIVVSVAMSLASALMVTVLTRSLTRQVATTAFSQADALAEEIESGIPLGDLVLGVSTDDEEFVQIVDGGGVVLGSSPNVSGMRAIAPVRPGATVTVAARNPPDVEPLDEPFLLVAREVRGVGDIEKVIVGRNLETVAEGRTTLTIALAVIMPLLLLVVGLVTWLVTARALSPVDAIRAEVDAISTRDLHRRVPDPPGDDEISRLAGTMNRMLERLEAGQHRARRFVSDASHELRSPVAAIRQFAEVALAHPERTAVGDLAEVVLEEDARLQRLVEDLLLLTRIDEGTIPHPTGAVDLDDLLLEDAARLRATTDLKIDVRSVSAGRVIGDAEQLERLIRNLTDNAARHARGVVRLSLKEVGGRTILCVDDDGIGLDPAERERVFQRFVRLDAARDRDSGGSGLGLSIVREVATFHGGSVRILDSELGGTRFEVDLPAQPD
jgi:signal transduction histidine kinase